MRPFYSNECGVALKARRGISQVLVTIITPTFNRADFLPSAIESVLGQTFRDFELIIVDDGSTDSSCKVIQGYQQQDDRVVYIYQHNQGQSVARNRGLAEARGEFICFLDSDNAWLPEKLDISLQAFRKHPEADVVYGDFIVIDAVGKELGVNRMRRFSGRITAQLLRDNFVSMNTTMTRTSCFRELGEFKENERMAEDYELWLRFSTRFRFRYVPEVLGFYRVMEDQISTDKDNRFVANEALLHDFLNRNPDAVSLLEKRRGLSNFYVRKARYGLGRGRVWHASVDIFRALILYPFWFGPWRALAKLILLGKGRPAH